MGLFDGTENLHGALSPDVKRRVTAFLDDPTPASWDQAYYVLIRPFMTIWQAVRALDPTFPHTRSVRGWDRIPDAILVARAIRAAVAKSVRPPRGPSRFAKG